MTSTEVKAEVASYLRFVLQYEIVCIEQMDQDVIAVDSRRHMVWVEVKVSISDLLRDRTKSFHQRMRHDRGLPLFKSNRQVWTNAGFRPARFYFAMPQSLVQKARPKVEEWFPWAGLLSVIPTPPRHKFFGHHVHCARPPQNHDDLTLDDVQWAALVKSQSASLANVYAKYARLKANHETVQRP